MSEHRNISHALAMLENTRLLPVLTAATELANGLEAERATISPANRKRLEDLQAAIEEAGRP